MPKKNQSSISKFCGLWFGLFNLCWPFTFFLKSLIPKKTSVQWYDLMSYVYEQYNLKNCDQMKIQKIEQSAAKRG